MGRIALFVLIVGGVSYLVIDAVVPRLTGRTPPTLLTLSLSVIVAVILWTIFVWFAGDRLGSRGDDRRSKPNDG